MHRGISCALLSAVVVLAACTSEGTGRAGDTSRASPAASPVPPPAPPAAAPADPGAAPAPAPAAPAGGTTADGRAVYTRTCQTCHQATGQGMPGAFPPLANSEYVTGDKARLIRIVLHGLTGPITVNGQRYNSTMAPWKHLSDAEIAAVTTYVRSSFGNSASAVTAEEVAQVRAATANRTSAYTVGELER